MTVLSKDPKKIHDGYKEAVVDSLLNNVSARLSGRAEFYQVVYGTKPSIALMSEFIVPMPPDERLGDEEADPIRISAHGLDFQVRSTSKLDKLLVRATGAVYVRILPLEEDVKSGGRLEAVFPLTSIARAELRTKIRAALEALQKELAGGKSHPDWAAKSLEARKAAYESMGIPFENARDRSNQETETATAGEESADSADGEGDDQREERAVQEAKWVPALPDQHAQEIPPPSKWLRLNLQLPDFEFSIATAVQDAKAATDVLNEAIAQQLVDWSTSKDEAMGGLFWGYRRGIPIRPSTLKDWKAYLQAVRASKIPILVPKIELKWVIDVLPDPIDPARTTIHVALENWSPPVNKTNHKEIEPSLFQVSVSVAVPAPIHQFLRLDRVKPSYRYNRYLRYPALGFNGGVTLTKSGDQHVLSTTWIPRYVLPRVVPRNDGVELRIAELAKSDHLDALQPLITSYETWLKAVEHYPVERGLEDQDEEQKKDEREKHQQNLKSWRAELAAIRTGLEILRESRKHWSGPGVQKSPSGIPFEAWVSMNAAMAQVAADKGYEEWRLFQLAFILASIPVFATRIDQFHPFYTPDVAAHADAVTLLYFATGGGKSEAFLGLLVFVLFLDRLRGKSSGVSALMRYPLRLLTLQQARRTLTTMGQAEKVRYERHHPGQPFSLGFWVGGGNTPNWPSDEGYDDVPMDKSVPPAAESAHMQTQPYKGARERWLKLTSCPFCGSKGDDILALRRHSGVGGNALGHFCTASKERCSWNARFAAPTPLPFYIVDEDIYDLAPSVLLGTIDKLAVLGQSQGTIRKFFGMFGFAPLVETANDRLYIPFKSKEWAGHPGAGTKALFPSFANGQKRFFDPFPSLLIQDEAHLLDESLGTFAGLFESALEAAFDELAPLLKNELSFEPGSKLRRRIKVIAASATVNEPHRQMRNLYQRRSTIQFPSPGPDLYESFYATPKQPDSSADDVERATVPADDVELRSHWARLYASILTNGHRHTVAMASVLGHYHLAISSLYERLRSGDAVQQNAAREDLLRWVSPGPLHAQHSRLLTAADPAVLLTLVDLHRIALTYVTNKKGGDQVIDTENVQFEKLHNENGLPKLRLASELISGGVSAAEIQEVVRRAEKRVERNTPFPELNDTLRSIVATSAISHGVDVEEFNAMFFAGIPSDIAEYIQASSRVGRTHVGFSLLVPVPQRHRDRFVLEIHDIFHRFLERMILPAAVDRWAEKALVRVMPSFFQEFVCGIDAIRTLCELDEGSKQGAPVQMWAKDVGDYIDVPANFAKVEAFMERALGLNFSPSVEGKQYYRALLKQELRKYQIGLKTDRLVNSTPLNAFFKALDSSLRPMTSLRDVDMPGVIREAYVDAGFKKVREDVTARAMLFIRRGSGTDIDFGHEQIEARGDK